jgi:phosphatidylglycerophosphate synthase
MDLSQIISLSFWFNLHSSGLSSIYERLFFILFAVFIICGSVCRIMARNKKGDRFAIMSYKMTAKMFMTLGILGILWFFCAYEQVYFFGARFWFLVFVLAVIIWVVRIVWFVKVKIPILKTQGSAKQETNKYLPIRKQK